MQAAAGKPLIRVRPYEAKDGPSVRAFWSRGFQELTWDLTRTLGPVGGPGGSTRMPRPALALLAAAGGARLALTLARREAPGKAAAALAIGIGGLAALHWVTHNAITQNCAEACSVGDMSDIAAHWQVEGDSAFFVAELISDGTVVGSVAVRRGGLADHDAPPGSPLTEPRSCSVWKVSTAPQARGLGVARLLMAEAENWAAGGPRRARAHRVVLMTASPGAKMFYAKLGYELQEGSALGTQFSVWSKPLPLPLEDTRTASPKLGGPRLSSSSS